MLGRLGCQKAVPAAWRVRSSLLSMEGNCSILLLAAFPVQHLARPLSTTFSRPLVPRPKISSRVFPVQHIISTNRDARSFDRDGGTPCSSMIRNLETLPRITSRSFHNKSNILYLKFFVVKLYLISYHKILY